VAGRVDGQPDLAGNPQAAAAGAPLALALPAPFVPALDPVDADDGWGNGPSLPSDHPAWARDAISLSQRARALLAHVVPVVLRVIAFWEHRTRSIDVGGRTLFVDTGGSYRFER
jgi:hypothetical protein